MCTLGHGATTTPAAKRAGTDRDSVLLVTVLPLGDRAAASLVGGGESG